MDVQGVREDYYPPGGGPALAGLLPGMPGEGPGDGNDHEDLLPLREALHLSLVRRALAEVLPGVPNEAEGAVLRRALPRRTGAVGSGRAGAWDVSSSARGATGLSGLLLRKQISQQGLQPVDVHGL